MGDILGGLHKALENAPGGASRQDDSLDAMASGFNVIVRAGDGRPRRGSPFIVDADDARQQEVLRELTTAEISRSPSLSMFYATRGRPLSGEERALLHPDAERRRWNRELVTDVDDAAREQFSGAVVYLFGAISKDPDYKRRFSAAQRYCERWGMLVLNPARQPLCPAGRLSYDFYMQHCFADIRAAELLVPVPSPFLEGSNGSAAERSYAVCLGKPILDGFIPEEV